MLGNFWDGLGDPGPSWAALWAAWAGLDGSWGHLGKVLCAWLLGCVVGPSWTGLSGALGHPGRLLGTRGSTYAGAPFKLFRRLFFQ